jgi:sugar O-acyltransferase (sialic acid O-acetyltransferase NeuD family)
MSNRLIVVLGAGGHASVVISTVEALGLEIAAVLDDQPRLWGSTVLGHTVVGPISALSGYPNTECVLGIGANASRRALAQQLSRDWAQLTHPTAFVHPTALLGEGTVVFANVAIQPNTTIGDHAIINTGATVDHDCRIGDFVHIAPGAHLAGDVSIGAGCLIGIGANVLPGTIIGDGAVIGAGSVIIRNVPSHMTVAGNPARQIR